MLSTHGEQQNRTACDAPTPPECNADAMSLNARCHGGSNPDTYTCHTALETVWQWSDHLADGTKPLGRCPPEDQGVGVSGPALKAPQQPHRGWWGSAGRTSASGCVCASCMLKLNLPTHLPFWWWQQAAPTEQNGNLGQAVSRLDKL